MKSTSFKQRLLLLILGIVLAFVVLEAGLRIAGSVVLYLQERHNHLSFDPHEYRILCLGESTTALGGEDSYPSQLEAMLNSHKSSQKFTVINKGLISTTSNYILAHADQNLDTYKPQLVIVMMGINDKAFLHDLYKALWWEKIKLALTGLRVCKLVHLLTQHMAHRLSGGTTVANMPESDHAEGAYYQRTDDFLKLVLAECVRRFQEHMSVALRYQQGKHDPEAGQEKLFAAQSLKEAGLTSIELARRYRLQGRFEDARKMLEQAAVFIPNHQLLYQEQGEYYLAQNNSAQAIDAFRSALALAPKNSDVLLGLAHACHQQHSDDAFLFYAGYLQVKPQDYWGYIELAQWLKENRHYDIAQRYLGHAMELSSEFDQAYLDFGLTLQEQGLYQQEEAFYLKEISLHPNISRLYQALGALYQKQGKGALSKENFQKAAERGMPEYCPATLVNYSLLLDKIINRHIKVIVMQYPLRDIGSLKDYFADKKGLIFVENRENFKKSVTKDGYNRYFKDNFAYDFGHCTRAGNELIARNLTEVILK